jgi:hypothetical protein
MPCLLHAIDGMVHQHVMRDVVLCWGWDYDAYHCNVKFGVQLGTVITRVVVWLTSLIRMTHVHSH